MSLFSTLLENPPGFFQSPRTNKFKVNVQELNNSFEITLCQNNPFLVNRSAVCYKLDDKGEILFDLAGCLECGTYGWYTITWAGGVW